MRKWEDYKKTMDEGPKLGPAAKANDLVGMANAIHHGEDIDAKDHRGYSPLMLAVYAGHLEATEFLLKLGADPNSCDFGGNTVLMGAAFKGHEELLHLLLKTGADPSVKNKTGMTAADFAVAFGRTRALEILRAAGTNAKHGRLVGFLKLLWGQRRAKAA